MGEEFRNLRVANRANAIGGTTSNFKKLNIWNELRNGRGPGLGVECP